MKYNININQKSAVDMHLDIDFNDLAVFDFILVFANSGNCKKLHDKDQVYFWISWEKIKEQLPLLKHNSKSTIKRHINNLVKAGLLELHPENQSKAMSYYKFGANYDGYFSHSKSEQPYSNLNKPLFKSEQAPYSNLNNYNNNNNNNNNNNIDYNVFLDYWNEVNDCKLRITSKKRSQIKARLKVFTEEEIKQSIKNRSKDEWINGEGKKFKTDWNSFWRNDEKVERYLNAKPKKVIDRYSYD